MRIGAHEIAPKVLLAPMAGVTDKPFRQLCRQLGAGLCVSEMTTSGLKSRSTASSTPAEYGLKWSMRCHSGFFQPGTLSSRATRRNPP